MRKKPKKKHLEKCYGKLPPAPKGHKWEVMEAFEIRKVGQLCVCLTSCDGYWCWSTPHSLINKRDESRVIKPYVKAVKINEATQTAIFPCPFCGGESKADRNASWAKERWVTCTICNANGPEKMSKQEAVEEWNNLAKKLQF